MDAPSMQDSCHAGLPARGPSSTTTSAFTGDQAGDGQGPRLCLVAGGEHQGRPAALPPRAVTLCLNELLLLLLAGHVFDMLLLLPPTNTPVQSVSEKAAKGGALRWRCCPPELLLVEDVLPLWVQGRRLPPVYRTTRMAVMATSKNVGSSGQAERTCLTRNPKFQHIGLSF